MMLQEQLEVRMMLNKTGAFSIKKGSRTMLESLNYAMDLLSDPGNMVVMFPQGAIHSIYDRPVVFEKGWYRIIQKAENPFQVVFFNALVDYYSNRKPTLNFYLYDHNYGGQDHKAFETSFNDYYLNSLDQQRKYL